MKKSKKKTTKKCQSLKERVKLLKKESKKAQAKKKEAKKKLDKKLSELIAKIEPLEISFQEAKSQSQKAKKKLSKAEKALKKCQNPSCKKKKKTEKKDSNKVKEPKKDDTEHPEISLPPTSSEKDNLKKIEGVGPKIEELLHNAGILTFGILANSEIAFLKEVLAGGGSRFGFHKPDTWPEQAALAANEEWEKLKDLQDILKGGKR